MVPSSPEKDKNFEKRLNDEQHDFEETIRYFSDHEKRQTLAQFEQSQEEGMTFARSDGSVVCIGDQRSGEEDKVLFSITISQPNEEEPEVRHIVLSERYTQGSFIADDGNLRQVVYDLTDLKGRLSEAPKAIQWLIDAFGYRLIMERPAPNGITRLENETQTLGFDADNVRHLADFYQQGLEHNRIRHKEVVSETIDEEVAKGNKSLLDSISLARALGKVRKAARLEQKFRKRAARENYDRSSKYSQWLDTDLPAISNVRKYRRN